MRRLNSLEVGRGLAALSVVLFHINEMFVSGRIGAGGNLFKPLAGGYAGVHFFFVLSGFLMAHLHWRDMGHPEKAAAFMDKRLKRIYPLYWVVTLAILPMFFILPGVGEGNETHPLQILASLTLFPTVPWPILGVAWTLRFEMLFYLLFALTIWRPRIGGTIAVALAAGAVIAHIVPLPYPLSFLMSPYILLFAYGVFAARIEPFIKEGLPLAITGLVMFGMLFVAAANQMVTESIIRDGLGMSAAFVVAGAVADERQAARAYPRALVKLGAASYALYLVHYHAIAIGAVVLERIGLIHAPRLVVAAILLVVALVAGFTTHYLIEKPVGRLLRKRPVHPSSPIWT